MRILVVEDEPTLQAFLQEGLAREGYHVSVASDGAAGEALARQEPFDLLILDLLLPSRSGLEVCASLRQDLPNLPILILTALDGTDNVVEGLNAGADDYLAKPFELPVLMARVRALLRRAQAKNQRTNLSCGDLELNLETRTVTRAGKIIQLTAREFALLEYMLHHKGEVVSRLDILDKVWASDQETYTNIVDVYINFLRKKIDRPFDERLIHTVTGMGYMLKAPDA
jgi:DNA-binding response OmpR family regulator